MLSYDFVSIGLFIGTAVALATSSKRSKRKNIFQKLELKHAIELSEFEVSVADVSSEAAWRAGKIMLNGIGTIDLNNGIESKIGSRDIVTRVDKECQETIRTVILSRFPDHKFLGEEDIEPGIEASKQALEKFKNEPHLWIVDPVDGTTNYAHGMPLAAVIIAYASFGEVKHGFIYDPFRNESFFSWKGKGSYMNGRKISCCKARSLEEAVVCTGSPPNISSLNASLRATCTLSSKVRSMRVIGSAAIMLMWVAIGRISAYFEADLNAWDLAAGALIIKEAGGELTDVWNNSYNLSTRNTVASNGYLHPILLDELQASEMWMK